MKQKYTNSLINETSPYLRQHAHNPVDWVPWSDDVFECAKKENKLVLISVGYSACHWCHVMEHESFEDEEVAAIMNKFFINVKVDREERPDVDQVYMTAVQLMTQRGGWPLNCMTLPDGRPIYGGTYFPKDQWMHILKSLNYTYVNDLPKVVEYAENLHEGIVASEQIVSAESNRLFEESKLNELIQRWVKSFDSMEGGTSRAPKFPLPNNLDFLLEVGIRSNNQRLIDHVELTLDKMAMGGIYDQIGGGFARYSVDMLWKVPHFEKMLYDNGQLIYSYAKAYRSVNKDVYKRVVYQTVDWLEREMWDASGAFYSALDADSEGVEGKFYVWEKEELKSVLGDDWEWVSDFYQVNQRGYWEDDVYILLRTETDNSFMKKMNWSQSEFHKQLQRVNEKLMSAREGRIRPGLDDKCLTSWNAMTIKGLCEAYKTWGEEKFLLIAQKTMRWIVEQQLEAGKLYRNYKSGTSTIEGFLEDYVHVIDAMLALYEVTYDEKWLLQAEELTEVTIREFYDSTSGMFFFTDQHSTLIARKMEINDNVIPASNSVMANNLYALGIYLRKKSYTEMASQMVANVYDGMEMYGSGYSNWGKLIIQLIYGPIEIIGTGNESKITMTELQQKIKQSVFVGATHTDSDLPFFAGKPIDEKMKVYVCQNNTCHAPSDNVSKILELVNEQS